MTKSQEYWYPLSRGIAKSEGKRLLFLAGEWVPISDQRRLIIRFDYLLRWWVCEASRHCEARW